jgi:hypothetical protein
MHKNNSLNQHHKNRRDPTSQCIHKATFTDNIDNTNGVHTSPDTSKNPASNGTDSNPYNNNTPLKTVRECYQCMSGQVVPDDGVENLCQI